MKNAILSCIFAATFFAVNAAPGASVSWSTTPGVVDTEVSTRGSLVFAYYFNSAAGLPATVTVNAVPFALQPTAAPPPGLDFNGSYNNAEGVNLYQVPPTPGNAGLNAILDGQNWGSEASLIVTGLTPGRPYEFQYMISDDRANFVNLRNYDVSDDVDPFGSRDIQFAYHSTRGGGVPPAAPPGSREAKIFTGNFVADSTGTQSIYNVLYEGTDHTGGNSGSQVNAIQLRLIPEPTSVALMAAAVAMLGVRRRRR
jgi:hypothetical protein